MQNQINRDAKRQPRDRRRITEGSLYYKLKIWKLWLFMGGVCNVLILRCYIFATKKAQKSHMEGRKNAGMHF